MNSKEGRFDSNQRYCFLVPFCLISWIWCYSSYLSFVCVWTWSEWKYFRVSKARSSTNRVCFRKFKVGFGLRKKKDVWKCYSFFKTVELWIPTRWCHYRPPRRKMVVGRRRRHFFLKKKHERGSDTSVGKVGGMRDMFCSLMPIHDPWVLNRSMFITLAQYVLGCKPNCWLSCCFMLYCLCTPVVFLHPLCVLFSCPKIPQKF